MNIHIAIPVWGKHYLDLLDDICLPTLLAPGNIPTLKLEHNCKVRFLTDEDGVDRLQQSPNYSSLENICEVEIVDTPSSSSEKKYVSMNNRIRQAYANA